MKLSKQELEQEVYKFINVHPDDVDKDYFNELVGAYYAWQQDMPEENKSVNQILHKFGGRYANKKDFVQAYLNLYEVEQRLEGIEIPIPPSGTTISLNFEHLDMDYLWECISGTETRFIAIRWEEGDGADFCTYIFNLYL